MSRWKRFLDFLLGRPPVDLTRECRPIEDFEIQLPMSGDELDVDAPHTSGHTNRHWSY